MRRSRLWTVHAKERQTSHKQTHNTRLLGAFHFTLLQHTDLVMFIKLHCPASFNGPRLSILDVHAADGRTRSLTAKLPAPLCLNEESG